MPIADLNRQNIKNEAHGDWFGANRIKLERENTNSTIRRRGELTI